MSTNFSAAVGAWANASEDRLQAVYRRSVEMLAEEMSNTIPNGGRVPFRTGNLARSLLASTAGMPSIVKGGSFDVGTPVGTVTATLRLEQPVWLGYQAAYARRQNYGLVGADSLGRVYNQRGHYFVEGAIASWQQIVARAVNEIKAGTGGSR